MSRRRRRSPRPAGKPASGRDATARCPSCNEATLPGARFCHACGTRLQGGFARRWWNAQTVALLIAIATGVAIVAVTAVVYVTRDREPARTAAGRDSAAGMPGRPPDLSRMSPRQAADRLFNRIMMASEQGRTDEVERFAPMALQAYDRLDTLDADARYHVGLIYAKIGDVENARRQIRRLKQIAPDHLLAIVLEHDIAEMTRDRDAASRAYAAFNAAYEAEIRTGRPEYEAHRNTIERFRAAAGGRRVAVAVPKLTADAQRGAALFARYCAGCHGRNAAGSETGPPLVHKIYEPSHHGDDTFYRAVKQGVQAHHWSFGDMAPVAGIADRQIGQIIAYVRALQAANGIR